MPTTAIMATVVAHLILVTTFLPSSRVHPSSAVRVFGCARWFPLSPCSASRPGIQGVSQPVPDEVEGQRGEYETRTREDQHPPGELVDLPVRRVGDHLSPRRH